MKRLFVCLVCLFILLINVVQARAAAQTHGTFPAPSPFTVEQVKSVPRSQNFRFLLRMSVKNGSAQSVYTLTERDLKSKPQPLLKTLRAEGPEEITPSQPSPATIEVSNTTPSTRELSSTTSPTKPSSKPKPKTEVSKTTSAPKPKKTVVSKTNSAQKALKTTVTNSTTSPKPSTTGVKTNTPKPSGRFRKLPSSRTTSTTTTTEDQEMTMTTPLPTEVDQEGDEEEQFFVPVLERALAEAGLVLTVSTTFSPSTQASTQAMAGPVSFRSILAHEPGLKPSERGMASIRRKNKANKAKKKGK